MKKYLVLPALLLVAGCVHLYPKPGDIHTVTSASDGTVTVSMEPAPVCSPGKSVCTIKLSLMHNAKMKPDEALMTVFVMELTDFSGTNTAQFDIDGRIVSPVSMDKTSRFNDYSGMAESDHTWTAKRYRVTKDFLESLLKANRVVVRIDLGRTYEEGVFSDAGSRRAKEAFQRFYDQVFAGQPAQPAP